MITGATTFWDSCHQHSFAYAANGRCPGRPTSVSTTHKTLRPSQLRTNPCSVKTTSNGWTAIRNVILASLARY
ncbi:hypothetical protein [Bathymodiolus platifrons methanotrophic gill symbiont]|uniref:hypothetical protein n=1 Tax=Bathymodiolus platifrons methanotrophic gill symbiont TaxID=113268 RepID=UPI001C8D37D2|nr:hypothetical protein [Bathymodiolus platifrons methanotrophic gill symbiont]